MAVYQLSDEAKALLRAGGWHPDRTIDIGPLRETLVEWGYEVSEAAEAVLREFGGLTIVFKPSRAYGDWTLTFDILETGHLTERRYKSPVDLVDFLGREVCPIGYASAAQEELFIDTDGNVYGFDILYLLKPYGSIYEAVDRILTWNDPPRETWERIPDEPR